MAPYGLLGIFMTRKVSFLALRDKIALQVEDMQHVAISTCNLQCFQNDP